MIKKRKEDKILFDAQHRKKPTNRNTKRSRDPWTGFEIIQVLTTDLPKEDLSFPKICRFIFENRACRETGQTFEERTDKESGFGHDPTAIKFIVEQAFRGMSQWGIGSDHGLDIKNQFIREMFEKETFDKYARPWIYRLYIERCNRHIMEIKKLSSKIDLDSDDISVGGGKSLRRAWDATEIERALGPEPTEEELEKEKKKQRSLSELE